MGTFLFHIMSDYLFTSKICVRLPVLSMIHELLDFWSATLLRFLRGEKGLGAYFVFFDLFRPVNIAISSFI